MQRHGHRVFWGGPGQDECWWPDGGSGTSLKLLPRNGGGPYNSCGGGFFDVCGPSCFLACFCKFSYFSLSSAAVCKKYRA